jgi:SagB-type dehydrogenase family enzyme
MALRALTAGAVASTDDAGPGDRILRLVLDTAGIELGEGPVDPVAGSGRLPGIDEAFHVAHRSNSPHLPQPALELDHDPDTRAALGVGPLSSRDIRLPDDTGVRPVIAEHWAARRSKRSFRSREQIHLTQLAAFLGHSARLHRSGDGLLRGAAPSGGNRQPLDFYVVAHDVRELPCGVYYYRRVSHRLCPVSSDTGLVDAFVDDARAALASDGSPAALVVVTGRFDRTGRKYQTPGLPYSLILKEVGAFFQIAGMVAAELGLGFTPLGAGSDRFFTEAVGGTSSTQGVVGECVLGLKDRQ